MVADRRQSSVEWPETRPGDAMSISYIYMNKYPCVRAYIYTYTYTHTHTHTHIYIYIYTCQQTPMFIVTFGEEIKKRHVCNSQSCMYVWYVYYFLKTIRDENICMYLYIFVCVCVCVCIWQIIAGCLCHFACVLQHACCSMRVAACVLQHACCSMRVAAYETLRQWFGCIFMQKLTAGTGLYTKTTCRKSMCMRAHKRIHSKCSFA